MKEIVSYLSILTPGANALSMLMILKGKLLATQTDCEKSQSPDL